MSQANKEGIKYNNNLFTEIEENVVHIYKGSLQDLQRKNQLM